MRSTSLEAIRVARPRFCRCRCARSCTRSRPTGSRRPTDAKTSSRSPAGGDVEVDHRAARLASQQGATALQPQPCKPARLELVLVFDREADVARGVANAARAVRARRRPIREWIDARHAQASLKARAVGAADFG